MTTSADVWQKPTQYFKAIILQFGEGNGNPLQYPCLENPMNRGAWQAAAHGVTKSWTQLSNFHYPSIKRNQFKNNKVPHKNEKCLVFLLKTKGTFWPAQ